jgi:hypothetical protein
MGILNQRGMQRGSHSKIKNKKLGPLVYIRLNVFNISYKVWGYKLLGF